MVAPRTRSGPSARVTLWRSAWTITTERPGGVGPGRFDDVPPRYHPEGNVRYAEHDFLQQCGLPVQLLAGLFLRVLRHHPQHHDHHDGEG